VSIRVSSGILEVGVLSQTFFKEDRDLSLEIRLATECQVLSSIFDEIER